MHARKEADMKPSQPAHKLRAAYEGRHVPRFDPAATIASPLALHRCRVSDAWVDYNQHMSESCYLLVFGDSSDAFYRYIGIDDDYRAQGHSIYSVETHLRHLREARHGEPLELSLRLIDVDAKRLHLYHEMHHAESGELLSTAEQLQVHVDMRAARSAPFPAEIQARLQRIRDAHAIAPLPACLGHRIAIRRSARRLDREPSNIRPGGN